MQSSDAKMIVVAVQRNGDEPPSPEYNTYEEGIRVAQSLDIATASSVVLEGLKVLPSCIAESFLEGLLDHIAVPHLEGILFEALPHCREVSSGGLVGRLLMERCTSSAPDIFLRLVAGIESRSDPEQQDRFAYALLFMFAEDRPCGGTLARAASDHAVYAILTRSVTRACGSNISEYTRAVLERVKRSLNELAPK